MRYTTSALLLSTLLFTACEGSDEAPLADATPVVADAGLNSDADLRADAAPGGEDIDMKAEDFGCILEWDKVRKFRITNKLGHLAETLAVANNPAGGEYPVGTVIQLVPFEAMVKRKPGWNTPSGDWEFFALTVDSTGATIDSRGSATISFQGKQCLTCHNKAQPAFDFVCEDSHGCDPLVGITPEIIEQFQNSDARCNN